MDWMDGLQWKQMKIKRMKWKIVKLKELLILLKLNFFAESTIDKGKS